MTLQDTGSAAESWSTRIDAEDVLRELEKQPGWDEGLLALIKQTPKQAIVDWKLMWRNPNPLWTSVGGLVVQLGDAAHSFLPTSANGATQACEDGISLATCLELAGKNNIPLATRVHNTLRSVLVLQTRHPLAPKFHNCLTYPSFERVSCAQRTGFKNREMWHQTDFEHAKRHPEKLAQMTGRWITDHDPEEYTYQNWKKCVNHLVSGAEFKNTNIPPGYSYKAWTIDELLSLTDEGKTLKDEGDWS